ncbi:ABC transporter G family member 5-like [Macadamia integrifolia]|uniref:ABC transporter G family member 5-like n=1 Tax=Macadamia integrifolia TaxID=60698 RepID=UPI001C4FBDC6|nr:ABC transporter G family member 5-like [Macadamia integrifolia]
MVITELERMDQWRDELEVKVKLKMLITERHAREDRLPMKKQGCEIEAVGINYKIYYPHQRGRRSSYPFKILSTTSREQEAEQLEPETKEFRHVLKNVTCRAKPWEILAIVGPSGAGKSTLLEILAGRLTPQTGSFLANQKPIDKPHFKKISGYVTQRDTLFPLLTVEETLLFSAKLRLNLEPADLISRVKSLMDELGLTHVASTRIGDELVRGISGGERRRVSIGVDVIHDPKVLILDEPTSGLDSTSALQIIDMLKTMAETRGRTIILSIHQPGFRIVKLFNSILLMADGAVLYHGTVDYLGLHLRSLGLQLPLQVNIVEFAIDAAVETLRLPLSSQQPPRNRSGNSTLQQLFLLSKVADKEIAVNARIDLPHRFANSRLKETMILTNRFSKNVYRTKELFACRTVQMLIAGLVLGSIFHNLKDDLSGAEERVGLFAFLLTFLLSCCTEALPIFLQERVIFMKETSCGSYRVSSYVIANGLVFLPFLLILAFLFSAPLYWLVGLNPSFTAFMYFVLLIWLILYTANSVVVCCSALMPNFIVGNSVISGVMGSFFLFSGYFIPKSGMPKYWVFMHYLSLFKYPFEGFLINEFSGKGKCLEYMLGECVMTAEDVMREEGFGEESRWRNVVIMVCFILVYRFISYVVLRCRCSCRSIKGGFA